MFRPLHVAMGFSKKRWRFIFENNKYDKERDSNYSEICFIMGDRDRPVLWKGNIKKVFEGGVN